MFKHIFDKHNECLNLNIDLSASRILQEKVEREKETDRSVHCNEKLFMQSNYIIL